MFFTKHVWFENFVNSKRRKKGKQVTGAALEKLRVQEKKQKKLVLKKPPNKPNHMMKILNVKNKTERNTKTS